MAPNWDGYSQTVASDTDTGTWTVTHWSCAHVVCGPDEGYPEWALCLQRKPLPEAPVHRPLPVREGRRELAWQSRVLRY